MGLEWVESQKRFLWNEFPKPYPIRNYPTSSLCKYGIKNDIWFFLHELIDGNTVFNLFTIRATASSFDICLISYH